MWLQRLLQGEVAIGLAAVGGVGVGGAGEGEPAFTMRLRGGTAVRRPGRGDGRETNVERRVTE